MPGDIAGLKPGRQRYTLLTNEAGGIIDDLMVANLGNDRLFLVVNASRKDVDFAHLAANLAAGVQARGDWKTARCWRCKDPQPPPCMARLAPDAAALPFMGVARDRRRRH